MEIRVNPILKKKITARRRLFLQEDNWLETAELVEIVFFVQRFFLPVETVIETRGSQS